MSPWGSVVDKAMGIFDDLIGDADLDREMRAKVRMAFAQANAGWNPQAVVHVAAGLSLVAYLNMVLWGGHLLGVHVPLFWEPLALLAGVWAIAAGMDLGRVADKLPELVKKLREAGTKR